jgi:hypothetical protein
MFKFLTANSYNDGFLAGLKNGSLDKFYNQTTVISDNGKHSRKWLEGYSAGYIRGHREANTRFSTRLTDTELCDILDNESDN